MRAPVNRAVPTAPFSHWMPASAGSKNARPLPAHSSVAVIVDRRQLLDLVERQRDRRVHLAADLQRPRRRIDLRDRHVRAHVEEFVRRDERIEQRHRRFEVGRPHRADDQFFLAVALRGGLRLREQLGGRELERRRRPSRAGRAGLGGKSCGDYDGNRCLSGSESCLPSRSVTARRRAGRVDSSGVGRLRSSISRLPVQHDAD